MIQLICTDKGTHPPRDIVVMADLSRRPPADSTARWHVVWREAWVRPRRKALWQPVLPLHPKYDGVLLHSDLIEADVWVFRCPTCSRHPRWGRDHLDDLCDRASAEGLSFTPPNDGDDPYAG